MGLLDGRVAFVTGAARGQGRSHALRLAGEGASVIAIDIADAVSTHNTYPPATDANLKETAGLLEHAGRPFVVETADVRDLATLERILGDAVGRLGGRLDVVVANAGICNWGRFWEMSEEQWLTLVDVNLSGVWRTMKAAVPHMISAGNGGSIITVSSVAGIKSLPGQAHYSAAKHGVVGLTNSAAIELGEYGIRVNSIHPWGVATPMGEDPYTATMLTEHPSYIMSFGNMLPSLTMADPGDISDAVVWLASDLSRTVTGTQLTLDTGATKV
ncbi:mycofactocin-coupled SDR family oxidoreductase [Mycobacterium branderi]|uniref:3-oxoacyl-[acyl-carrier-protein] reductase n=1 Tax=Mycobacterium branderi TaxID=43348 RepID=A0A7I7WBK3_9MYCO|nr:mycofactocin-coupled SDR family oxidoreductase [Mycobacterium branderi]MCV7235209.1 mycofactocin-coupled SDR family oxidoreductase [Mycobacterium branderi]ORA31855.1 3-oxoacyl-[acyl-carrier-protein] reductase [Mycobacterium branderi]BBZ14979.1 NAD-dependent oxidoreductase [Mycobacterium branderi]